MEGGMLPGVVHEVKVPILTLDQCRKMKYKANRITGYMLCAGKGSQDSCQGDSGGPLLVQEGDKVEIAGKLIFFYLFINAKCNLLKKHYRPSYGNKQFIARLQAIKIKSAHFRVHLTEAEWFNGQLSILESNELTHHCPSYGSRII